MLRVVICTKYLVDIRCMASRFDVELTCKERVLFGL